MKFTSQDNHRFIWRRHAEVRGYSKLERVKLPDEIIEWLRDNNIKMWAAVWSDTLDAFRLSKDHTIKIVYPMIVLPRKSDALRFKLAWVGNI